MNTEVCGIPFIIGHFTYSTHCAMTPQWGAADAEIKVPSGENTVLKRFPFKLIQA